MAVAAAMVLVPGAPLVPILFLTQVLNAILLLPILVLVYGISRDAEVMGEHRSGRVNAGLQLVTLVLIAACTAALVATRPI